MALMLQRVTATDGENNIKVKRAILLDNNRNQERAITAEYIKILGASHLVGEHHVARASQRERRHHNHRASHGFGKQHFT